MQALIDLVVAKCDAVLTSDGAIHPTLIKVLAREAAGELAENPATDDPQA